MQRFGQFGRSRLNLLKQAHILDGDHRLVREGLDKVNLALRKRAGLWPRQEKHALYLVLPQQRHADECATVPEAQQRRIIFGIGEVIADVLDAA